MHLSPRAITTTYRSRNTHSAVHAFRARSATAVRGEDDEYSVKLLVHSVHSVHSASEARASGASAAVRRAKPPSRAHPAGQLAAVTEMHMSDQLAAAKGSQERRRRRSTENIPPQHCSGGGGGGQLQSQPPFLNTLAILVVFLSVDFVTGSSAVLASLAYSRRTVSRGRQSVAPLAVTLLAVSVRALSRLRGTVRGSARAVHFNLTPSNPTSITTS